MRQRFAKGLGGTLRFVPPEVRSAGVPSSATVTLKRSTGQDLPTPVVDAAAAIDAATGELSVVLTAANTPDPRTHGNLYRALWTYVIAGVTYQADQVYEVNARLLKPTLVPEDITPLLPVAWEDLLAGGAIAAEKTIAIAWDDLLNDLVAHEIPPDRIMDVERLLAPHRSKTIALLYASFGAQWADEAEKKASAFDRDLDRLLAAPGWIDKNQDSAGSDTETVRTHVRLVR